MLVPPITGSTVGDMTLIVTPTWTVTLTVAWFLFVVAAIPVLANLRQPTPVSLLWEWHEGRTNWKRTVR